MNIRMIPRTFNGLIFFTGAWKSPRESIAKPPRIMPNVVLMMERPVPIRLTRKMLVRMNNAPRIPPVNIHQGPRNFFGENLFGESEKRFLKKRTRHPIDKNKIPTENEIRDACSGEFSSAPSFPLTAVCIALDTPTRTPRSFQKKSRLDDVFCAEACLKSTAAKNAPMITARIPKARFAVTGICAQWKSPNESMPNPARICPRMGRITAKVPPSFKNRKMFPTRKATPKNPPEKTHQGSFSKIRSEGKSFWLKAKSAARNIQATMNETRMAK